MVLKDELKQRLLEIPINSRAFRELYRLSNDLKVEAEALKPLLEELCNKNILIPKIEYICSTCRNTTIMTKEELEEIMDGETYFDCDECFSEVNPNEDKTGYIYYDVKDKTSLSKW